MNSRNQSFIIYAILFIAIIAIVAPNLRPPSGNQEPLTINQLAVDVQAGKVYYLRAHMRPGWLKDKTILEQLSEDEGLKLLKECKPPNSYRK